MLTAEKTSVCGKRCFRSKQAAKRANKSARFRFRLYQCDACNGWHVTARDKH